MVTRFYLPANLMPSPERAQAWQEGKHQVLEQEGKIACAQCWIYQTWVHLHKAGADVELVHEMPREGPVVAITGNIPFKGRPAKDLVVIGIVADAPVYPSAHIHVVQNLAHKLRLPRSTFIPHWTQPGLIPRDESRGKRFDRVVFFGDERNTAPELSDPKWREALRDATGCTFEIRHADRWHDYSDADAVVAVRDFDRKRHLHKPATKLYNAWMAGVPFIGGTDSAYSAEGEPDRDYLVARSPGEVIDSLKRLKNDESFRASIVGRGKAKSSEYSNEAIVARWRQLLDETIPEVSAKTRRRPRWLDLCCDTAMRVVCRADSVFRN